MKLQLNWTNLWAVVEMKLCQSSASGPMKPSTVECNVRSGVSWRVQFQKEREDRCCCKTIPFVHCLLTAKKGCKIWEAQRWNDPVKFHLGGLRMLRILLALQFLWNLSGAKKKNKSNGFPHIARSNSPTSEEFSSSIQKWPGNKACDAWQMRDARRRGTKSTFNPNSNADFRYSYIVEDCWSQNSPSTVADRLTPYPLTLVTSCNFVFKGWWESLIQEHGNSYWWNSFHTELAAPSYTESHLHIGHLSSFRAKGLLTQLQLPSEYWPRSETYIKEVRFQIVSDVSEVKSDQVKSVFASFCFVQVLCYWSKIYEASRDCTCRNRVDACNTKQRGGVFQSQSSLMFWFRWSITNLKNYKYRTAERRVQVEQPAASAPHNDKVKGPVSCVQQTENGIQ